MRALKIYLFGLAAFFVTVVVAAILNFYNGQMAVRLEQQRAAADPSLPQPEDCSGPSLLGLFVMVSYPMVFLVWTILSLAIHKTIQRSTLNAFAIIITGLGALPLLLLFARIFLWKLF